MASEGHPAGQFTNVWRRFRIPDTRLIDPTIYVASCPPFEAYIDNKLIFQSGVLRPDIRNKFAWNG